MEASPSSSVAPSFEGTAHCRPGEEKGAAGWDYGANPRGTIVDPNAWTRSNAVGLDPSLSLSFEEEVRGEVEILDDVVLATDREGAVVAFVEFGRDANGRYFPNYAEAYASAGIEEKTSADRCYLLWASSRACWYSSITFCARCCGISS